MRQFVARLPQIPVIIWLQPPECWDCRHVPPHLTENNLLNSFFLHWSNQWRKGRYLCQVLFFVLQDPSPASTKYEVKTSYKLRCFAEHRKNSWHPLRIWLYPFFSSNHYNIYSTNQFPYSLGQGLHVRL